MGKKKSAKKVRCNRCGRDISSLAMTQHRRFCEAMETPVRMAQVFLADSSLSCAGLAVKLDVPYTDAIIRHLEAGLVQIGHDDPEKLIRHRNQVNRAKPSLTRNLDTRLPPEYGVCRECRVIVMDGYDLCGWCGGEGEEGKIVRVVVGRNVVQQGTLRTVRDWLVDQGYKFVNEGRRQSRWFRGDETAVMEVM